MPRAERFLAEVKAKDEGTKEEATAAGDPGLVRREGRWGRISPARMRGACRDLLGRRLLRLVSVVRDVLSAIRFGVNVSCSGPHRLQQVDSI